MFTINGKSVSTFEDGDIVNALPVSELLEDGVIEFTLADESTLPYAWMVETLEPSDIGSVSATAFVRGHVEQQVNVYNYSSIADAELVEAIMDAGLADAAIAYVSEWKEQEPETV